MSTNKHALRGFARSASRGEWVKESGEGWDAVCSSDDQANSGFIIAHFEGPDSEANRKFVQAANPDVVLALLDELEAADNRINRLESIVAVAEKRNALMREWKRALKVPCGLVDDQVPVVIHGMVVRLDRLKEAEEKLAAAEKRIAELESEKETLRPVGVMSEKAFHRLEVSGSRFIALWPRPGIYLPRKRPEDGVIVYARTAGITVKGE